MTAHDVRALAVRARCDPRTVRRVLQGRDVKDKSWERIRAAMREMGIDVDVPERAVASKMVVPEGSASCE